MTGLMLLSQQWVSYKRGEFVTPMTFILAHKIEREGMLPNSFSEANTTLIPKPDTDTTTITEEGNYRPEEHSPKIFKKILANQTQ
jgi:hypothetical protein